MFFKFFMLNEFKLKHLETLVSFFSISVQKCFSYEVVPTILVNPYF